jgi:cold shock protein
MVLGNLQEQIQGGDKMEGTVKWFNSEKHFGFIESAEDGKDYFVHKSSLPANVVLKEGEKVTFDAGENDRGLIATNVVVIAQ